MEMDISKSKYILFLIKVIKILIFIYDDNSSQNFSLKTLNLDKQNIEKIKVKKRRINLGYTKNFLFALKSIGNNYDYYAFSDQDDIWHKDKLKEGIKCLEKFNNIKSALYGGRTELIGKNKGIKLGYSTLFKKKPSFRNALIQNIFGGNTMIFNKSAHKAITESNISKNIISHDWWYQIISGIGGKWPDNRIFTSIDRRNLIGSNVSLRDKLARLIKVIENEFGSK